ncbi:MAG: hypothetical protein ABI207_07780 [Crocinitomicaceae bacterium]
MKIFTTIFLILTSLFAFGQSEANWVPFKIKLVDNKDTLNTGFDFYLTSGDKQFLPTKNDSLNCFQFQNIDSLVDFHLIYKNNHYKLKNLDAVRMLYYKEWTFTPNNNATDTCYMIIIDRLGCFSKAYFAPYPVPICDDKNYVWVTSFRIIEEDPIFSTWIIKTKKSKRVRK